MICEYAVAYGGPPDPRIPWPLFLLLLRHVARERARRLLDAMNATAWGAARAISEDKHGFLELSRRELERAAYPERSRG